VAEALTFTEFAQHVLGSTYTRAQTVFALVAFDGVDPDRLDGEDREMARQLFGDNVDTVPPDARRTIVAVFGRGSGKDEIAADYSIYRMATGDIRKCGTGDVPVAIVIAPDLKLAGITKNRAIEKVRQVPSLSRCLESETADGFVIRRPQDGRLVAFETLAASRAGSTARGRSVLSAVLNETAFFRDEGAAINDAAIYSAILPRLMPGGSILLASTPWAEAGLFYDLYDKNYGRPKIALVAQASTLVMRGDDEQICAIVATETERDPVNAERELGARFIGIGSMNYFDGASIDAAVDPDLAMPYPPNAKCGRAIAADLGFKLDASALVIIQNTNEGAITAFVDEMCPTAWAPLVPSDVFTRFVRAITKYHGSHCYLDAHYIESAKEYFFKNGITAHQVPGGKPGKVEMHLAAKELLAEGKIRIPKHAKLISQLKSIIAKPIAGGGIQIITPRRVGQHHGDIASAWVAAAWALHKAGGGTANRAAFQAKIVRMTEQLNRSGDDEQVAHQGRVDAERLRMAMHEARRRDAMPDAVKLDRLATNRFRLKTGSVLTEDELTELREAGRIK
jgi:hypothetical protein